MSRHAAKVEGNSPYTTVCPLWPVFRCGVCTVCTAENCRQREQLSGSFPVFQDGLAGCHIQQGDNAVVPGVMVGALVLRMTETWWQAEMVVVAEELLPV